MDRPDLERIESMIGLLRAYGNVANDPTEKELWAGCKDASIELELLLAYIRRLEGGIQSVLQEMIEPDGECYNASAPLVYEWAEKLRAALPGEGEYCAPMAGSCPCPISSTPSGSVSFDRCMEALSDDE